MNTSDAGQSELKLEAARTSGPEPGIGDVITIVRAVAERWTGSGLNYAVVNGLDAYPQGLGRDIDVVTDSSHLQQASEIVCQVLDEAGWRLALRTRSELVQHIALPPTSGRSLIVDLFPGLRWGPTWLVQRPSPSHFLDIFPIDPWASFVKRVFLHVLVAPVPKFLERRDRLCLTAAESSTVAIRLPDFVGPELSARLLRALASQDLGQLQALRRPLRKALTVRTVWNHPVRACGTAAQWASARLEIATAPPAMPIVGIVGLHNVNPASVLAEVARQAKDRLQCPRVEIRDSGQALLPPILTCARLPHIARASRWRTLGRHGLLQSLYCAISSVFSYYRRDRPVSADLGLVLHGWSFVELHAHRDSRGPVLPRLMRAIWRRLPCVDLLVVLHASSTDVSGFATALPQAGIRAQSDLRIWLADRGDRQMTVGNDVAPALLAERILDKVVELFLRQNISDHRRLRRRRA
jgi:hypothetical protein